MRKFWKPFKWPGLRNARSFLFPLFSLFLSSPTLSLPPETPTYQDIPRIIDQGSLWTYIGEQPLFQGVNVQTIRKLLRRSFSPKDLEALNNPKGNYLNTLVFIRELLSKDTDNARQSFLNGIAFRDPNFITLISLGYREGIWGLHRNARASEILSNLKAAPINERLLNNFNTHFRKRPSTFLEDAIRTAGSYPNEVPNPKKRRKVQFKEPLDQTN